MAKTPDDLEAVRIVATTLTGFSPEEQERIIRWARERLGLAPAPRNLPDTLATQAPASATSQRPTESADTAQSSPTTKDLKTFVTGKSPRSDVQFAATVAYFYRFESPLDQRRNEIDAAILQDACRLAGRARLKHPSMTLNNAKNLGVVDSGSEAGKFTINTVGENLVAMTLPAQSGGSAKSRKPRKPQKATNNSTKKKK